MKTLKMVLCVLLMSCLCILQPCAFAANANRTYDLDSMSEAELVALAQEIGEKLMGYGYTVTVEKNSSGDKCDDSEIDTSNFPTDFGIKIEKCTWEMNEGFYSPMMRVSVTNNTGAPAKEIEIQVVFYNDAEKSVWSDEKGYLISSYSDTPLKNGYSKTGILRSTWGYKQYQDSKYLKDISYELYLNGELYFIGVVAKPGDSEEIQAAISAAKYLKSMLKNPSSIQVHSVYIEKTDTNPKVVLEISAQNGFGGLNRKYYMCSMLGTTCYSCNESEYFELLYKSDYKELDSSLIALSVEE